MLELITVIAAGAVAATFFSDILSRAMKGLAQLRRAGSHTQPAH